MTSLLRLQSQILQCKDIGIWPFSDRWLFHNTVRFRVDQWRGGCTGVHALPGRARNHGQHADLRLLWTSPEPGSSRQSDSRDSRSDRGGNSPVYLLVQTIESSLAKGPQRSMRNLRSVSNYETIINIKAQAANSSLLSFNCHPSLWIQLNWWLWKWSRLDYYIVM